jgi:pSer/pThr/pTyr-binding forkhead associated (FHA) protein
MKLCLIVNKGKEALSFDIKGEAVSIGRSKENDIHIQDKYVSRKHLVLWKKGNRVLLKNLANRNGTKVDGHQVPSGATVEVKEGDTVKIGMSVFCFGRGNAGDMFAFLNSLDFCKKSASGETTTLYEDTL